MTSLVRQSIDDPRWGVFSGRFLNATAFHHPAWASLLAECYGYRPFALALANDTGETVAGLPIIEVKGPLTGLHWVSLPFTDCCPPLADNADALSALTDGLVERLHSDGVKVLEVRAALPECEKVHFNSNAVMHTLTLSPDPQAVFRTFKKTQVQQCIVKAERGGVTVRRGGITADLDVFYNLHLHTRRRVGTPVQPRRYFELLWKHLIEPGLGFLLLAYKDHTPLAGAIFLAWNGTVIYKYSASNPVYWKLRPNNLVLWTAIKWGCENGYHTFDFGRTDLGDQGLRDFKNGWGTREEPLVYSVISDHLPKPSNGRLSQWMGAIIRRSPPLVCRAIGELFYKYAA